MLNVSFFTAFVFLISSAFIVTRCKTLLVKGAALFAELVLQMLFGFIFYLVFMQILYVSYS